MAGNVEDMQEGNHISVGEPSHRKGSKECFVQGKNIHVYDYLVQNKHMGEKTHLKLYPMLLAFSGLPGSKKSTALSKLVQLQDEHNSLGFSHNEFVASGFGSEQDIQYCSYADINSLSVESLKSGIGMMNIWDLGVNRRIIPFLFQFSGHYSLNYMWLFVDLDRDLPKLHLPPDVDVPLVMKWRSRVQYLFRSCHLSKGSNKKKVCKIFAAYNDEDDLPQRLRKLWKECSNVAKQMGMEELVDTEVIPVNIKSEEAVKIFKCRMQSLLQQLEPLDIPVSWMSLRDSLAQYHSMYITHDDLEDKAEKYGISADDVKTFCRLFTSFGSILDVQLIDSQSKYIIVKPSEFLQELHHVLDQWESPDLTQHGIIAGSSLNEEKMVFLQILCSVGLAARVPHTAIFEGTTISDPAFYIPSIRTGKDEMRCTRGAIQLVIGMKSTPVNMHIRIIDYLLQNLENAQLILTQAINTIGITTPKGKCKIEITSQGDVIEIFALGEKRYGRMYKRVCEMIYTACNDIAQTMATQSRDIKYHFAVTCVADRFKEIEYNIYHRRHVLPSDLCEKCNDTPINEDQITIWNTLLKQKPVEQRFKLNGKLEIDEITSLAVAISSYHPWAINIFAKELGIDLPNKPRVTNIVGGIINWSDDHEKDNEESAKKVLARKLIKLDATWKNEKDQLTSIADYENAEFKQCARQLDIQVYAENQFKYAVKDIKPKEDNQKSQESVDIPCSVEKHGEIEELKRMLEIERKKVKERDATIQEMKPVLPETSNIITPSRGDLGLRVVKEKVFSIEGGIPLSLDWSSYGFKMHIPLDAIPPSKVVVKALLGGEFQFPKGMELVSALYVIKFDEKLSQSVKLEIQHSVSLTSSKQVKYLSFITAPIDESVPPYKFEYIEGGEFSTDSQYGVIFRSKFCLMGIGKSKGNCPAPTRDSDGENDDETSSTSGDADKPSTENDESDEEEVVEPVSSDLQQIQEDKKPVVDSAFNMTTNNGDGSTEEVTNMSDDQVHEKKKYSGRTVRRLDSGVPDSLKSTRYSVSTEAGGYPGNNYKGRIYYEREDCNIWKMKFLVVQDIPLFLQSIETNYDIDFKFAFLDPVNGYIELDTVSMEQVACQGWHIEPDREPLILRKKDADLFGSDRNCVPESCLVTVWAELSCNPTTRLRHPLTPMKMYSDTKTIYISRFLETEKSNVKSEPSSDRAILDDTIPHTAIDTREVKNCIKGVLQRHYASLCELWESSIKTFANKLFGAGIITDEVRKNPENGRIIDCFLSGFAFRYELPEIEKYCITFFDVFYEVSGPFIYAVEKIKKAIKDIVRELGVELKI